MTQGASGVKSEDENSHRLYNCRRCGKLVLLCRRCDRGNIYCFDGCARLQRAESVKRARLKYQRSERGRLNHKVAQQRYRAKLDERGAQAKVMDHGSHDAQQRLARASTQATEPGRKEPEYENHNDEDKPHRGPQPRGHSQHAAGRCHRCGIRLLGRSRRQSVAEVRRWRQASRAEVSLR